MEVEEKEEENEENTETSVVTTYAYDKNTHGEFHFLIDASQERETESSSSTPPSSVLSPMSEECKKKPAFNFHGIKQKLGGGLDKDVLFKNKEKTQAKSEVATSTSSVAEDTEEEVHQPKPDEPLEPLKNLELDQQDAEETLNRQYENQLFDITSKFQKTKPSDGVEPPPAKRKRPAIRIPQKTSRRERLEKDICSPTLPNPASSKRKAAAATPLPKPPAPSLPPPPLPETSSKHKYTVDLFHNSILVWDPTWLEQGRDELEISAKLNSVPFSYDSFDDYMKINWPLMLLETWAQLRRDWEEQLKNTSRQAYRIESFEEKPNVKISALRCTYEVPVMKDNPRHSIGIFEQDLVSLSFNDGQYKVFGIVDSIEKGLKKNRKIKMYTLTMLTKNEASLKHFKSVIVVRVTSLTTVLRQWYALIKFQNSLLCKDILKPFRPATYSTREPLIARTNRLTKLNQDQFKAVSSAVQAVKSPFGIPKICLIQGPPGTGKSYTVKTIITHLAQVIFSLFFKEISYPPEKSLNTAFT